MNFDRLDEFLAGLEATGKAGVDCAICMDGRPIHRFMRGMADIERGVPVTNDTVFRFYSMTKPITCVAALQLYEQGKFLMTDPVSRYLPEFSHMVVEHKASREASAITIQQLFTMTSGLSYNLYTWPLTRMAQDIKDYTTRDFVRAIAQSPLLFEPGEHWCYSLAHDVLGALIEVLTGMRFGEYLEKNVFAPLGIKDAWFHMPEEALPRAAVRYGFNKASRTFIPEPEDKAAQRYRTYQRSKNVESGGAGLNMTVDAYAQFALMLANLGTGANGVRILNQKTVNLMRENHLTDAQLADFDWIQHRGYGYGLGVRTLMNRAQAGALGEPGEFGWTGAAGTFLLVDPGRRLALVYAQQATPSDEAYIHPRLRNLLYAALDD